MPEAGGVTGSLGAPRITVAGVTAAGASSLLPEALAAIEDAGLLCGGRRHLAFFPGFPGARHIITADLQALYRRIEGCPGPVVVLASGDPNCYGIGPLLAERFGAAMVRVLPNVSAVQLAFARLGVAWQDAAILSCHGRPLDGLLPRALFAPKVAILTDAENNPGRVAEALLAAGEEDALADVFERLGGPQESHFAGRLSDLPGREFDPLNILVVRKLGPSRRPLLGLPDTAFVHRKGLITKAEVRAVSLAALGLREGAVLWDVGAGCGSVAIEAGGLAGRGHVYAIERDPDLLRFLAENRRRLGAGNVVVVQGSAPEVLASLPDPDAVFVGGSGGALPAILGAAMARVRPGGRIVANLVLLDHVTETLALARKAGWEAQVSQVSVSRGAETAGRLRLEALNPVFVVALLSPRTPEA